MDTTKLQAQIEELEAERKEARVKCKQAHTDGDTAICTFWRNEMQNLAEQIDAKENTNPRIGQMTMNSAFNRELNKTITRMEESQAWQVHDAIKKGGKPVRGSYYEGGPLCVEVRVDGNPASCLASVYDTMYDHNNDPRKVSK